MFLFSLSVINEDENKTVSPQVSFLRILSLQLKINSAL